MADISDVEQALTDQVTSILYPAGSEQPSVIGTLCRVYRGWPNMAALGGDLSAGNVNITIVPDNEPGRNTTRYLPEWSTKRRNPGVTVATAGLTVEISGTPAVGDVVGILVDNVAYAYRIQEGDSPGLIAACLYQSLAANRPCSYAGSTVTIPGAGSLLARAVADATSTSEIRRQEKDVRVICWCPTPAVRDAVGAAIDFQMASLAFLTLDDGTMGRIVYKNTTSSDQSQNALLYRRDLVYSVEYPTIVTVSLPSMLFGELGLDSNIIFC